MQLRKQLSLMLILIEPVKLTFLTVIFCNIYTVDCEELLHKYHNISELCQMY